jgi:GT2 family glycosyltransferase/glycosyltransferase involved in cell wall biosynthesis
MYSETLLKSVLFRPSRLSYPDAWVGHIPFAAWLVQLVKPLTFVELGTHSGNSYLAFCQAVQKNELHTKCYAVDTWKGDEHAGYYEDSVYQNLHKYHQDHYGSFSQMLRMTFDDACQYFSDESIDLLHIDGLHTYEAVKRDFETWLPKLAPHAIVLFHDTNVREREFGVWKLWEELCVQYPFHLEFLHSHGLGVLQLSQGKDTFHLDWLQSDSPHRPLLLDYFAAAGQRIVEQYQNQELKKAVNEKDLTAHALNAQAAEKEQSVQALKAQVVEKEQSVQALKAQVVEKEQSVQALKAQVKNKESLLNEIVNSKAWKVVLFFRRIRVLLIPPNSRRARVLRQGLNVIFFPFRKIRINQNLSLIRSSGLFDEDWYLSNNADVAQAEIDPARHYLLYGGFEGRDPGPYFSTGWYLTTYEDVEKSGINPLIHYLKHGREEGRSAQSADVINEHDSTDSFEMNQIDSNNKFVPLMDENFESQNAEIKLIAFYLPQYHPIPENDAWWGKGFTEWTNVSKAKPNFMGHYQPHLPGELGFYDLRIPEIQERQVELAKKYGIYGFCFYYYWFDRKRLLELPINNFMKNPNIDFPFCLCWANENWSRTWDGSENNILIAQNYSEESHLNFIRDIAPALLDKRYIRVDGKPLLLVYNVNSIPNPQQAVEIWRAEAKKMGIGEVYLVAVQSFGITDPRPFGFDAAIEFPPHPFGHTPNILHDMVSHKKMPQITNPQFNGGIFDYQQTALLFSQKKAPDYTLFKTIIPSWDNTARRQNTGDLFINSSPRQYRKWLDKTIKYTRDNFSDDKRFIFINAWNEWGEGTYLEPDRLYGYAYLQATYDSLMNKNVNVNVYESVSDPNKGEKNTQIKTVHSIRTLFQSITLERVRKALGYFVRGDIKNLKYKLLFLSQNTEPDSIYDTEKIELEYCAQFFRPKTENQTFQGKLKQEIDIIVPVFNGMDFLPVLFDSLYKNTDEPFRVIIIDDKSTDISVRPFLENLAAKYRNILLLFNEENKGFVKTINIASTHVQNHFVILNTDVEVPEGWLQRLMKPIIDDKNIASTTPFTNAGTIFSFPQINVDNNIFAGLDVNKVDSVFKLIDADLLSIDVPTGVGFCMGMNLDVWKKIGNFDENAFGRGYGEENDWCLRANSAGYRNVMVPNLFVYHKHGGSFLPEEKQKLIQGNLQKIFNRYPNYPVSVDNYIKSDPPKPLRMFASLLLMKIAANTEPVLVIDHGLGGGAGDYCTELVQKRLQAGQVVFLLTYSGPLQAIKLQVLYKEYETFFKVSNIEEFLILRDFLKFGEILYNNLVGYSDPVDVLKVILQIKNYSGAKLVAFVHDYYLICPSYTLIDNHGNYCDLPPLEICKNCLPKNSFRTPHDQQDILVWREAWTQFLDGADEVVCFSKNSQDLIKRAYAINDDKITVIPHNLLYTFKTRPNVNFKEPLCIGVVGTLNYHKGQAMVLELAKILAAKYPDIRIVIIGTTTVPISSSNITITGRYEKSDLPGLIEKYKINLCFFPSIWPETFSYVTSELMDLEMPICSFNLGAPAERIGQYKLGHLISEITAETAAREIVEFYNRLKKDRK